jgi:hypothetical protein
MSCEQIEEHDQVTLSEQREVFKWLVSESESAAFWLPQVSGAAWFRRITGSDPRKMIHRLRAKMRAKATAKHVPIKTEEWTDDDLKW